MSTFDPFYVSVIVVAILAVIGITYIVSLRGRDNSKDRHKLKLHDGEIVAIGDVDRDVPQQFRGKGAWSSKPIQLEPGNYRLRYAFSSGAVRVGLVSSFDGENETLLIKSGSGVEGFEVEAGGRYIFEIQPADETAEWTIEYQHLTRYGVTREEEDEDARDMYRGGERHES